MAAVIGGVPLLFVDENFGHRLAKTVDALLDVPHKKQVAALVIRKQAVQQVLNGVCVLVFVDHHNVKARRDLFCKRRFLPVRRCQKAQGQMFKIRKFQYFFFAFCGKEFCIKQPQRIGKGTNQRFCCRKVLAELGFTAQQLVAEYIANLLFNVAAQLLHNLLFGAVKPAYRGKPRCLVPQQHPARIVPPTLFQQGTRLHKAGAVGLQHRLIGGKRGLLCNKAQRRVAQIAAHLQLFAGALHQLTPIGALPRWHRRFVQRGDLAKGLLKKRQRAQVVVHRQQRFARLPVGARAAKHRRELGKLRVFVRFGKHLRQHGFAQLKHGGFIRHRKIGRDIKAAEMLAQQLHAKRADGGNAGPLQQHLLAAQRHIAGLCAQQLF